MNTKIKTESAIVKKFGEVRYTQKSVNPDSEHKFDITLSDGEILEIFVQGINCRAIAWLKLQKYFENSTVIVWMN